MELTRNDVIRHIAESRNRAQHDNNHKVSVCMLDVLAEMALLDICPDSTFSDDECLVWEVFRKVIRER